MNLSELPIGRAGTVVDVRALARHDPIAERLRDLGFVAGEMVRVVAHGPFGREPMLVQTGFTRFALRRSEAKRVTVTPSADA